MVSVFEELFLALRSFPTYLQHAENIQKRFVSSSLNCSNFYSYKLLTSLTDFLLSNIAADSGAGSSSRSLLSEKELQNHALLKQTGGIMWNTWAAPEARRCGAELSLQPARSRKWTYPCSRTDAKTSDPKEQFWEHELEQAVLGKNQTEI